VSTRTDTEVQDYLNRLRRELAGLPAAEVEEIIQDVEPHLAAIAEELSEGTLADVLGDPGDYARELRGAMGMPDAPVPWLSRVALGVVAGTTVTAAVAAYLTGQVMSNDPRPALWLFLFGLFASWLAIGRSRSTVADIAALPEVRQVAARLAAAEQHLPVAAYLRSLRPGWILLRAVLVCVGVLWLCHWFGWYEPIPGMVAVAFAVLTVMVGLRAQDDRRWLWLSVPLGGWAVGAAVKALELLPLLYAGDYYWP